MANLPETPYFTPGIYQLEPGQKATGGLDGLANLQAKQLAARTLWLKQRIDGLASNDESPIFARYLLIAGQNINNYKLITTDGAGLGVYASSSVLTHVDKVIGVSYESALTGEEFVVAESGSIANPSWNWVPGSLLFLGLNGDISATPAASGFNLCIGYAKIPTEIILKIGRSTVLA